MNATIQHLDDARCADIVLGLLTPAERADATSHAVACAVCAARLRRHASVHERWRTESECVPTPQWRAGPWPWGWAAAAAMVAVFLIPRMIPTPRPTAHEVRLAAPAEGVLMREGEAEDRHLRAGLDAYAAGDLVLAQRELEQASAKGSAEEARRLYLAQTLMLRGETSDALALLRSLNWLLLPSHVQHDAVALYARALRASGRPASADSVEHALERTPEWQPIRP